MPTYLSGGIAILKDAPDEALMTILWAVAIPATSALAIIATIYSVVGGMTEVFPHLYYIPILLNAYRNPRRAIPFAMFLGAVYAGLVYHFTEYAMGDLVRALIRVLVFIWVAAIISYLAGNLKRRNSYLSGMNEIITAASTSASLDEILSTSAGKIREILGADLVMVFLVAREGKRASLQYQEGVPPGAVPSLRDLDLKEGPFCRIVTSGKAEVLEGTGFFGDIPLPGITSFVAIPLPAGVRVPGIIVAGRRGRIAAPEDETAMLATVSQVIGSEVKKALLQGDLALANTKANLYLDIMSHDINNVNTVSLGYAQLLTDLVNAKGREMLAKMEASIRQSVEIIRNVSTIRRIQEGSQELRGIDLDPVIRAELDHEPDLAIEYAGTAARVCGNSLVSEVFRNLIGNSAKFGGPKVHIRIAVEDAGDLVRVSVEDDGPGIPDDLKPRIFNRFQKGKAERSGKGLGLYICRMIVEGCGGIIGASDRVPGEPKKGAAIRFTLRKSCAGLEGKNLYSGEKDTITQSER